MPETILVTGGSGFIGSYVLRALAERGDRAINFDVRPPGPEAAWYLNPVADRVPFVQGSIDELADLVQAVKQYEPAAIVHIGAIVHDLPRQPQLALRVNVGGTVQVLEVMRIFGLRRLVYFSTIGVLTARQYEPIDARHPVMTATDGPGVGFYAASKVASEVFCWSYRQSFGTDFITIRPSAVYGFGQQVPNFIKPMVENAVRGAPSHFATGGPLPRDYTHVLDVTQLTLAALDVPAAEVRDRIFYGATGEPLNTAADVAEIVKRVVPGAQIEIGSGIAEEDQLEMRFRGRLSIDNAREQLGYRPRFLRLEDGVAEYIQSYRQFLHATREPRQGT
ncbi:MAG: NAD-dependent epimerase/dehydratase family protein [Blastocatellia bacterium]